MIDTEKKKGLVGTALATKIASAPKWFAKTIFDVITWFKQDEIIASVFKHRRTAVRGCVSSTKTFAAALVAFAWLMGHPRDGRVFHLAPSFRQVNKNLFGYMKALDLKATQNGKPLGARVYEMPRIVFGPDWEYTGFTTKHAHNVHGIHGPNDLIILDDAHGISQDIHITIALREPAGERLPFVPAEAASIYPQPALRRVVLRVAEDRHDIDGLGLVCVNGDRETEIGRQIAAHLRPRLASVVAATNVPMLLHEDRVRT